MIAVGIPIVTAWAKSTGCQPVDEGYHGLRIHRLKRYRLCFVFIQKLPRVRRNPSGQAADDVPMAVGEV
jgi:hypothetical protein